MFHSDNNLGAEWHEEHCQLYLKYIVACFVNAKNQALSLPDHFQRLYDVFLETPEHLPPNYYSRLYSEFMTRHEAYAETCLRENIPRDEYFDIINVVEFNQAPLLEEMGHRLIKNKKEKSLPSSLSSDAFPTSKSIENTLKGAPTKESLRTRASSMVAGYKNRGFSTKRYPYAYMGKEIKKGDGYIEQEEDQFFPEEFRFSTKAQYKKGARISPSFTLALKMRAQRDEKEAKNKDKIIYQNHLYINNMKIDDDGSYERKWESSLTKALQEEEEKHPNLFVITLPADGGLLKLSDIYYHSESDETIKVSDAKQRMLAIAMGESKEEIRDFYLSPKVERKLFKDVDKTAKLNELLDNSFEAMGVTGEKISPAQQQAVYFHFIKYELTHFILETLKPATFNITCKDGIDRGGVASAYYHLIRSIQEEKPLNKEELTMAIHGASALVKARGMNFHQEILWNAVHFYLKKAGIIDNTLAEQYKMKDLWNWYRTHRPFYHDTKKMESTLPQLKFWFKKHKSTILKTLLYVALGVGIGAACLFSFGAVGLAAAPLVAYHAAFLGGALAGLFASINHFFQKHRVKIFTCLFVSGLIVASVFSFGSVPAIMAAGFGVKALFTMIGTGFGLWGFASQAISATVGIAICAIVPFVFSAAKAGFGWVVNSIKQCFSSAPAVPPPSPFDSPPLPEDEGEIVSPPSSPVLSSRRVSSTRMMGGELGLRLTVGTEGKKKPSDEQAGSTPLLTNTSSPSPIPIPSSPLTPR